MKLNPLRRKPGWQSRDPSERARALADAPLEEIAPHLAELVRGDESPEVRRVALGRLDDLALLADRMRHDTDRAVRDAARQRYKELLADPGRVESERARVLGVEDDQDVLAHVATAAAETALRRAALERVARPGLLIERCQRDPDPDIRLWLLSRIDAPATLARIAEAARKGDKLLARAARERLEALKLAAGDPATLRARALAICDTLDALRRERPDGFEAKRATLAQEWSALSGRVDESLARRVEGYFAAFEPAVEQPAAAEPEPVATAPAVVPTPEPTADEIAAVQAAQERADAADRASRERADAVSAARESRRAERAALTEAVAELERATSEGKLAAARGTHAAIAALRERTADPGRELVARIAAAAEAYEELARWQHWSNNKVRSRLCSEVEAMVGSGVHPDAVAAKVKEAQLAWQRLDESEAQDPEAAAAGIAKRFRSACHRAIAPTRKYFEKRRELRDGKREQVDALLAEADRELVANPHGAPALRRRVVEALQRLDELDPRVRGEQGRRLRAMLTRFDAAQAERAVEAEAAKRKLLANLRREVARAPLADAIEKAKHAQAEWKRIGRAPRETEEALSQELRALIDPFFEKAGAQRAAEAETRSTNETEARAILAELEALGADPAQAAHADPRVAALVQRWRALPREPRGEDRDRRDARGGRDPRGGRDDRGGRPERWMRGGRDEPHGRGREARRGPPARDTWDERAFDRAVDRVREAQRDAARATERTMLVGLREAASICARIEDGADGRDGLVASFEALTLPADTREAMRARLDAALAQDPASDADARVANGEIGEILAVRAELVAGTASPDVAKELRRRVQLERLAERMRGGAATEPRAEAREILIEWCALGPIDPETRAALATRVYAAIDSLGDS